MAQLSFHILNCWTSQYTVRYIIIAKSREIDFPREERCCNASGSVNELPVFLQIVSDKLEVITEFFFKAPLMRMTKLSERNVQLYFIIFPTWIYSLQVF